ncbi:hypothetical protein C5167_019997 [Papaver somniferum]|uniref:Uncharacterized protein n=1 Tax=Papaver somniferum TaxID=3469 RepID=A0A4Y7ITV2_PAPSO|nr:hypothetical protein C5167_019997 [Papaver somniferum]
MWIVDDLQSFRACPYDDVPRSALFIGPSFLFFGDSLDSENSDLDDDEWDFVAMATPGFIPGYFEGSPHELKARGHIKLAPEIAAAAGIKSGSRGKNSGVAQKGKNKIVVISQPLSWPRFRIPNSGESATSSEGQGGSQVGETLSPRHSFSGSSFLGVAMGRAEKSAEQNNSRKRKQHGGQMMSGSRYPDPIPPPAIGIPSSLVGQATWFAFKGNAATVVGTYSHYIPVYNFLVPPELREYYKEVVESHGHVASTEVLSDRNTLISSVSTLVAAAKEMVEFGDVFSSVTILEAWRSSFGLPQLLHFKMGWIEELFKELEDRRAGRQLVLPGEITSLKAEVKAETQILKEQQKEQMRITAEASRIAAEVSAASSRLESKRKELADKEAKLASFE